MRPLHYLNGRTLSPVPAEARHFGLRHCSRAASSELDIGCESKPRNYSRDIAGARFPGKHRIGQVTTDVKGEHTRADITSCWPTIRELCVFARIEMPLGTKRASHPIT